MAQKQKLKGMIGLEVHAYAVTKEKLFCECNASREKGLKKNTLICPICTGQPGAKPMMANEEAVRKAVMIGLMLGCKINDNLAWQRKHYDWPDLPKGYQTTLSGTYAVPVGVKGEFSGIRIRSMHLEEDPAAWDPKTGCVDYNRSGLPLVEIITEPDFVYSDEVVLWIKKLVHALAYLKAVDTNAGIKADVNVNIPGRTKRVEIKNVNSIESIKAAIDFELDRQLTEGQEKMETRRFDGVLGRTMIMRGKEGAEDYRFISDPDLVTVNLNKKFVDETEKKLPEKPDDKLKKLVRKYKIDNKSAEVLAKNIDVVEFFEKVIEEVDVKFAIPWVTIELLRFLKYNKTNLDSVDLKVEHFVELLKMVKSGKITPLQGKQILNKFYPKSFSPGKERGKIDSTGELGKIVDRVISGNKKAVNDFKAGDKNALNFLIGTVMKETDRRADFGIVRKLLEKKLS